MADPVESAPGHPEIVRVLAANPGPMTLAGTNTYVVAAEDGAWVIDPGPNDAGHLERVRDVADDAGGIAGVLLTHGHSDHSEGVEALGGELRLGQPTRDSEMEAMRRALELGFAAPTGEKPAHSYDETPTGGRVGPFRVIATPGHAHDHVAFVVGDVCFCGDLILGFGSSIVPPAAAGGSLAAYLTSLEVLGGVGAQLLAPGHGPWITDPAAKIAEYTRHRLDRERRLLAAVGRGERSRAALVAEVWDDVPEPLRPAAAIAMQAHLEKLEAEGRLELTALAD